MKKIKYYFLAYTLLLTTPFFSQINNPNFDENIADKLNADEYGMKIYTLVLLSTGKNSDTTHVRDQAFETHMENIKELISSKKMIISGPVGGNEAGLRGIFILNTDDLDKAKNYLKNDQAIQKDYLSAQYISYYGSAALPFYLDMHDKIWKKKP